LLRVFALSAAARFAHRRARSGQRLAEIRRINFRQRRAPARNRLAEVGQVLR
jgi:hypothetical protein